MDAPALPNPYLLALSKMVRPRPGTDPAADPSSIPAGMASAQPAQPEVSASGAATGRDFEAIGD